MIHPQFSALSSGGHQPSLQKLGSSLHARSNELGAGSLEPPVGELCFQGP